MSEGIFLIQNDGQLVEMTETAYDSEALLQELLAKYPSLLAGNQINPTTPRRWVLVMREAGIASEPDGGNRWSVDHLFLDQDGIPTLVEVKRSSDTRIRREVVGQILDYAANAVVYWPIEQIRSYFERTCQAQGIDPEILITQLLGEDTDPGPFWTQVKTNLEAQRIRLVFVADVIPPELRRIVEFLNVQMSPAEVLAVEIKQFAGEGLKTLVPRVLGLTAEAQQKKSGARMPDATILMRRKYWNGFIEYLRSKQYPGKYQRRGSAYYFIMREEGCWYAPVINDVDYDNKQEKHIYMEFVVTSPEHRDAIIADMKAHRDEIDQALGEPLRWDHLDHSSGFRLFVEKDADPFDEKEWPNQFAWYLDRIQQFERVLKPYLTKALSAPL